MKKNHMIIVIFFSLTMLLMLIVSVGIYRKSLNNSEIVLKEVIKTEIVYITESSSSNIPTSTAEITKAEIYTVRTHMGVIGIFNSGGELIRTIDVYIKVLPEADRRMLEEGFEVVGKQQLNSIIEDYTG